MCGTLRIMQMQMERQRAAAKQKREEKQIEELIKADKAKKQESSKTSNKDVK